MSVAISPFRRLRTELGRLLPEDALPVERDVDAERHTAEQRLETPIPQTLVEYHQIFGGSARLNDAHNHILALNDIYVLDGAVAIVEENQRYYSWGVMAANCSIPNPPVVQKGADDSEWWSFSDSLQCFLVNTLGWQLLSLMPAMATGECTAEIMTRLDAQFSSPAKFGIESASQDEQVFFGSSVVCVAFPQQGCLYAGGINKAVVTQLQRTCRVSLSWC